MQTIDAKIRLICDKLRRDIYPSKSDEQIILELLIKEYKWVTDMEHWFDEKGQDSWQNMGKDKEVAI